MKRTLFIAYSQDSESHKAWVKKFAHDLEISGDFEVLLDQNLPKGYSLTRFMELGIPRADKVLVIGTPEYKRKSELGKGAAFEGSIISTELMNDIDSLKYYPILRSGTFETSFPTILQGRKGEDFSNDDQYEEKLQIVVDSIINEKPLPTVLINGSPNEKSSNSTVANVDLSQGTLYETYNNIPTGRIEGVAIELEITNKTKETRYFNSPTFQLSHPLVGTKDSFSFLNSVIPVAFPAKLEYGQQISVAYKIEPSLTEKFIAVLGKDPHATIKAIVTTTLGERSESAPLEIAEIVENSKYVKQEESNI